MKDIFVCTRPDAGSLNSIFFFSNLLVAFFTSKEERHHTHLLHRPTQ
jgi:hypothetical protein